MPPIKAFSPYKAASSARGPFPLTPRHINRVPQTAGVYFLVRFYDDGSHHVIYVGRHFRNVRGRLAAYKHGHRQTHFYFKTTGNKVDTYLTECEEFHRYGGASGLRNRVHPNRPKGYDGPKCSKVKCGCH